MVWKKDGSCLGYMRWRALASKNILKLILGQHELPELLNYGKATGSQQACAKIKLTLASQFTIDWIESKREHVYNQGIEVMTLSWIRNIPY